MVWIKHPQSDVRKKDSKGKHQEWVDTIVPPSSELFQKSQIDVMFHFPWRFSKEARSQEINHLIL